MGCFPTKPESVAPISTSLFMTSSGDDHLSDSFFKWVSFALRNQLTVLKRRLVLMDDRMAQVHQTNADQEQTLRRALLDLQDRNKNHTTARDPSSATCEVCANTCQDVVRCPDGHIMCLSCIDHQCQTLLSQPMHEFEPFTCICFTEECRCEIPEHELMRTPNGSRYIREKIHKEAMQTAIAATQDACTVDDMRLRMRYLCKDGTYSAHACPFCNFGPLEHFRCNDLSEFHGSQGYTNACPRCQRFVDDTNKLQRWDGTIISQVCSTG